MTTPYEIVKDGGVEINGNHYDQGHVLQLGDSPSDQIKDLIAAGDIVAVDGPQENTPMFNPEDQEAQASDVENTENFEAAQADESSADSAESNESSESSNEGSDASEANDESSDSSSSEE